MRVDAEVGTIEAGKRADLLVLEANPSIDSSNICKSRSCDVAYSIAETAPHERPANFGTLHA